MSFKVGDRVKCVSCPNRDLIGCIGTITIVGLGSDMGALHVRFDRVVTSSKKTHASETINNLETWMFEEDLELIDLPKGSKDFASIWDKIAGEFDE